MILRILRIAVLSVGVTQGLLAQGTASRGFLVGAQEGGLGRGLWDIALPDRLESAIPVTGLAPTYEPEAILALARTPADRLFAVVRHDSLPNHLYEIAPETGQATFLTEIAIDDHDVDLDFDDRGILWATSGRQVHRVDLATGTLTALTAPGGELRGVASLGDELFSVQNPYLDVNLLVRVDRSSGSLSRVAELSGLRQVTLVTSLDFDDAGQLWILSDSFIGITIPDVESGISRVRNIHTGVAEAYPLPDLATAFALAPGQLPAPLTDVPTLGPIGLTFVALVLLAVGVLVLRQDRWLASRR